MDISNKGSAARQLRDGLKRGVIWLTRGQLLNLAAAVHGQPTPLPARGPGRGLEVRPDDTFIVSYPRSGNTWLRFLVANLFHPEALVDYSNIERLVPDIYVTSEVSLRAMLGPRVLKSHEAFDPRYRKVIYAIRDPREVIASQYVTLRRVRGDLVEGTIEGFVERQIAGEFDAWFGSWSANVNSWVHHDKADIEFLLVRYEHLVGNAVATAASIASFLGLERSEKELRDAVANSSRVRLRELYDKTSGGMALTAGQANAGHLQPNALTGRALITPAIEARLRVRYGETMSALGY